MRCGKKRRRTTTTIQQIAIPFMNQKQSRVEFSCPFLSACFFEGTVWVKRHVARGEIVKFCFYFTTVKEHVVKL
jgi:hypothetical protein